MKVVISDAARADLMAIGDFIGEDNPGRADTFISELILRCLDLGPNPFIHQVMPRYERYGYRQRPHGRYVIIYQIGKDAVSIVRVFHGARDLDSLLGG